MDRAYANGRLHEDRGHLYLQDREPGTLGGTTGCTARIWGYQDDIERSVEGESRRGAAVDQSGVGSSGTVGSLILSGRTNLSRYLGGRKPIRINSHYLRQCKL